MGEIAIVEADTTVVSDPTTQTYGGLIQAFDHFNAALFGNMLPLPLLSIRNYANSDGYYSPNRFGNIVDGDQRVDEIALNPRRIGDRSLPDVLSTLVHEMAHQAQYCLTVFGRPSRPGYHNKQWGRGMKAIGLYPSATGSLGGRETGQHMSHYIIPGGPFEIACNELLATGFTLDWTDILPLRERKEAVRAVKYSCPTCDLTVKGEPNIWVMCGACDLMMLAHA